MQVALGLVDIESKTGGRYQEIVDHGPDFVESLKRTIQWVNNYTFAIYLSVSRLGHQHQQKTLLTVEHSSEL